jgi:hypothetical protein
MSPARSVTLAAALSALVYSCAPEFDRLTRDYGKASGGQSGQAGSGGCSDESCGGSGAASGGSPPAGGTDSNHGGAGAGGAGEGGAGAGGADPGNGGAGAGGESEGGSSAGGADAGNAGVGATGEGGAGAGGASEGGAGAGGMAGSGGIEPDPELPILKCGGGPACSATNVLVDMEANDGRVCATSGRAGGTFFFNDGTGEQWPAADPLGVDHFSPLPACRDKSAVALHTKGTPFTSWGAGVVIKFADAGWDASAFTGISFWAMSATRTRVTFAIATTETQDVAFGGDCVPKDGLQCSDHFATARTINQSWTAYTVTFAELRQRGFGVPAPSATINPRTMMELNITFPTGQPFDVWIDDVVFIQ